MKIENEIKLDFKDVLFKPKRSSLDSRKDVDLIREFTFPHSGHYWRGVPIIAANMDTVGTLEMHYALSKHQMMTALHKHHWSLEDHFMGGLKVPQDPTKFAEFYLEIEQHQRNALGIPLNNRDDYKPTLGTNSQYSFYSLGRTDADLKRFSDLYQSITDKLHIRNVLHLHPLKFVCIDVANGYTESFLEFIKKFRASYPLVTIMAGNVVTADVTHDLIMAGVDIVKVGIGPGSVCTTRKMTGVGYPQLSAVIECAEAAHSADGLICSDGGCTVPGDVSKAFGGGADFVMLGGMLAGHDQSGGDLISEWHETSQIIRDNGVALENLHVERKFKEFYGMSSDTAMNKHNGGVAEYRASEGKTVRVPYRGDVQGTIQGILGGLRSTCTYVGASRLKDLTKVTTFVRVTQQINEVFGKAE